MLPTQVSWRAYSVAVFVAVVALGATYFLQPWLELRVFPLFFAATAVSAWYGGLRPGLVTTVLSALILNYFFTAPVNTFAIANFSEFLQLLVFCLVTILINSLHATTRAAKHHMERAVAQLQASEAALRESEHRFRHLTDTAPMLVWMSGLDKLCYYFNKGWLDFTGRTMAEEMGNGWLESVHPEDVERCVEIYTRSFEARQDFKMEYRLRRGDGEYRWILDIGVPRYTPEGNFLGYIGSCIDIQDRRQAEAEIRQMNETLEHRVQERTRQLEAANQELESFSYSVSHDLRAPLRHISGFTDLLQKQMDSQDLDVTSQRYLQIIADTTQHAAALVDNLLAFSRMGRAEMRYIKIEMKQLVQEALQDLQLGTTEREIQWQIAELPVVQGDPAMLRLVFQNLLENAIKYSTARNPVQIEIGSTEDAKEVIFFVRDNGIGFNMQYAHKLFGVFQRLHSDPQFEGTGIGLANVQRIVHRHGGRTWAEGAVDQGATFYFSLPKSVDREEANAVEADCVS